jgi:hypothetical protein
MFTPGAAEPTPFIWFVSFVLVLLGLWLGRYVPDIWKGGPAYSRMKRFFDETYGGIQGSAFLASLPIDSAFLIVGGVMALGFLVYDASTDGRLRSAIFAASYVVVPVFFALLLLLFSVILFGRPKLIIPPHLRRHRGVIPEFMRWAARRLFRRRA